MKKNIPLILAIAIPILMVLFVAGSIYLPGLFVKPHYNFLYETGISYAQPYLVENGTLIQNDVTSTLPTTVYPPNSLRTQPELFVYDVLKNQSEPISFADAQKLSLNENMQSPDGFIVIQGGSGVDDFPFFYASGDPYGSWYLTGHNLSKKLNLQIVGNYYNNVQFLAWINN